MIVLLQEVFPRNLKDLASHRTDYLLAHKEQHKKVSYKYARRFAIEP